MTNSHGQHAPESSDDGGSGGRLSAADRAAVVAVYVRFANSRAVPADRRHFAQ